MTLNTFDLAVCQDQGHTQGVCLAVMTDPFVPQVLSIKADKVSNAVNCRSPMQVLWNKQQPTFPF